MNATLVKEALQFYACAKHWERPHDEKTGAALPSRAMIDSGERARAALASMSDPLPLGGGHDYTSSENYTGGMP